MARLSGFVVLVALMMLLVSACGSGVGGASYPVKSNADLLKEAASNGKSLKSYHVEVVNDSDGELLKLSGDVDVASKNMKFSSDSTSGLAVGFIQVGGEDFMSADGGQHWSRMDDSAGSQYDVFLNMGSWIKSEEVDKAKDNLKDGTPATEIIDGASTRHIIGNVKDLPSLNNGNAIDATVDIWVSTGAKPIIRQIKTSGSGGTQMSVTIKWTKIDEPVTIERPTID